MLEPPENIMEKKTRKKQNDEYMNFFNGMKLFTGTGAVNRSGEYRPRENTLGHPSAEAGEQSNLHNPRKQRKNPATAGSGERVREGKWRRGWVWNPTFSTT